MDISFNAHHHIVDLICTVGVSTIFTWLNGVAFISLVPKIDATTIQNQPLLNAER